MNLAKSCLVSGHEIWEVTPNLQHSDLIHTFLVQVDGSAYTTYNGYFKSETFKS